MKIISHRGNLLGESKSSENSPQQILYCLSNGYDVEIDLWKINDKLFLGHDSPDYGIDEYFLLTWYSNLWIHCKNSDALFFCIKKQLHCFWHQNDDFTLTSKNYIWTFPKQNYQQFFNNQVILDFSENPNLDFYESNNVYGVCVDFIYK